MDQRTDWWRGAVIYQINPRSFQDDDGDGSGDLEGITRRLPHVAGLGVDAIWLSPVFTSPMADMGYDVADHRAIDPLFGSLGPISARSRARTTSRSRCNTRSTRRTSRKRLTSLSACAASSTVAMLPPNGAAIAERRPAG